MSRSILTHLIAMHAKSRELDEIRDSDIFHLSPAKHQDDIILSYGERVSETEQACDIHIKAAQGWSLNFFKLSRDVLVLDTELAQLKNYGCYSYFFLGKPSQKQVRRNVLWKADGEDDLWFRIRGIDFCNQSEAIFYRPCHRVVVLRGDYKGPAIVSTRPK